ncbi:hypothetical protein D1345_23590 [Chromobacterium rhizoryzae]|uniref:Uncharacterized protein n=1 Tax=Chromobacterium rhizoryzae TaxID=1778675 RepID=A0AAD0RVJ9_9NEIS|nr:hypothetical protein D1345_23590 [Chromobacterium rhizoryzae]
MLKRLRRDYPCIHVRLLDDTSGGVVRRIESGEVCNDPALSAQVRLLIDTPSPAFSSLRPGGDAGGYRTRSSLQ